MNDERRHKPAADTPEWVRLFDELIIAEMDAKDEDVDADPRDWTGGKNGKRV